MEGKPRLQNREGLVTKKWRGHSMGYVFGCRSIQGHAGSALNGGCSLRHHDIMAAVRVVGRGRRRPSVARARGGKRESMAENQEKAGSRVDDG